jgi:hypothetical protein
MYLYAYMHRLMYAHFSNNLSGTCRILSYMYKSEHLFKCCCYIRTYLNTIPHRYQSLFLCSILYITHSFVCMWLQSLHITCKYVRYCHLMTLSLNLQWHTTIYIWPHKRPGKLRLHPITCEYLHYIKFLKLCSPHFLSCNWSSMYSLWCNVLFLSWIWSVQL